MGTYSELMKAGRPNLAREPLQKGKKTVEDRAPSRNCNIVIAITVLQSDIGDLRKPTESVQTVRLRESDVEILKDTAYLLGKNMKKKVSQSDVVRLALRIVQKLTTSKEKVLEGVVGQIK
jgi:hypothetical protein